MTYTAMLNLSIIQEFMKLNRVVGVRFVRTCQRMEGAVSVNFIPVEILIQLPFRALLLKTR
jgi:hypothetical protein